MGLEGGDEEEEEEEEGEISPMCESIGHRPLRDRCPKTVSILKLMSQVSIPDDDRLFSVETLFLAIPLVGEVLHPPGIAVLRISFPHPSEVLDKSLVARDLHLLNHFKCAT